jgi:hypothetical protein
MNSHSRLDLLAKSMARAAKRAETSNEYPTCPNCGHVLEGWRTDDVTSDSDSNNDEDNVGDRPAEYDNRRITKLNALAKSLTTAYNKSSQR